MVSYEKDFYLVAEDEIVDLKRKWSILFKKKDNDEKVIDVWTLVDPSKNSRD